MSRRYKVRLSNSAIKDLRELHDNVSDYRGALEAAEFIELMLDRVATLENFPNRGSLPREMEQLGTGQVRQIAAPPYRIFYRIVDLEVRVFLMADGRRNLRNLLQRRMARPD